MVNFNFQMNRLPYQIFKIILSILKEKHGEKNDNPPIRTYVNTIENKTTFKIKTGYFLGVLTPETRKLLRSTDNKVTKDENNENKLHLQIIEVILVHYNIVNNDYQQDSRVWYKFVPNKLFGSLLEISPKKSYLFKNI